jgi:hypothetical protein
MQASEDLTIGYENVKKSSLVDCMHGRTDSTVGTRENLAAYAGKLIFFISRTRCVPC